MNDLANVSVNDLRAAMKAAKIKQMEGRQEHLDSVFGTAMAAAANEGDMRINAVVRRVRTLLDNQTFLPGEKAAITRAIGGTRLQMVERMDRMIMPVIVNLKAK